MKIKRVQILDVPFDCITENLAVTLLVDKLKNPAKKAFFVATPNPEMLLEARKNRNFKKILQHTDLNIPDGIGIIFASKIQGTPLSERVTGTDLIQSLCAKIGQNGRIFLLGAARGVAEKTAHILAEKYHSAIAGTSSVSAFEENDQINRDFINKTKPDLLFVAFGAPKQELWLARNLPYLPTVKIAIGVGGAFDFIAGVKKRAPRWMQKTGLEWMFRLIQEPRRIIRIFNATIRFPLVFIKSRLQKNKSTG